VTTSRFLVSAAQPFPSSADLASLEMPVLLIRGDDAMHPAEVSDLYAAAIRDCAVVPASVADVPGAIGGFADRCVSRPS
jgi:pimeloyl-ACP methyl ester carboxylesterase